MPAWLGGSVIVRPGVTIGENAVVRGGSVVTRDVPAQVLAVGDPACVVRPTWTVTPDVRDTADERTSGNSP
jgi:maltose O-acetyltransferase